MKIDIAQIKSFHPKLRRILTWLEYETGFEFCNTSPYRIGDKGVHGTLPLRGWDIRCRNKKIGAAIRSVINQNWIYDPDRPSKKCCMLHGEGKNLHLHVQVHPNTVRR